MLAATYLAGQVFVHLLQGKIYRRNTIEQMGIVGPESLLIVLLTATFVGMVSVSYTHLTLPTTNSV